MERIEHIAGKEANLFHNHNVFKSPLFQRLLHMGLSRNVIGHGNKLLVFLFLFIPYGKQA